MALRFAGIAPGTNGDHCPAVIAEMCARAFEAVWERAILHADYRPA